MFKSARIKLTASYAIIVLLLTLTFSGFVYAGVSRSTDIALIKHQQRIENQLNKVPGGPRPPARFQDAINIETAMEVKKDALSTLLLINIGALIISGTLGYWLAGKTLKPIEEMTNKQKRFIADAAHEIKTPITAIKTQIEVTNRDKKLSLSDAKDTLKSLVEDIDKLNELVSVLLLQSRYEDAKSIDKTDIKINKILKECIKNFEHQAKTNNVSIHLFEQDIIILGEKSSLTELFNILIDNAIKFNKKNGDIKVKLESDNDNAIIIIEDTGIGISKKDLDQIFDRFYKVESSRTKNNISGYGLGLSIAKEIVSLNNGSIRVESELGKGTTFTIKLPLSLKL